MLVLVAVQTRGSTNQSRAAIVEAIVGDLAKIHDPYLLNAHYPEES